jgi:hypothetical protein
VGALAHYLEREGISTTQISLIREHTETIKPPRALWVPFALGRPLGAPGNPEFQHRVLLGALELLETQNGPLIKDFPENSPDATGGQDKGFNDWSCPVSFKNRMGEGNDLENLCADFNREVAELRPWYDLNLKKTSRTTMVAFSPDSASKLLGTFAIGEAPEFPEADFSLTTALRLATQDLKAFYFEAVTARPDSSLPSIDAFNQWFWHETAAAGILKAVKERCLKETDESLRMTGALLLIPMDQQ